MLCVAYVFVDVRHVRAGVLGRVAQDGAVRPARAGHLELAFCRLEEQTSYHVLKVVRFRLPSASPRVQYRKIHITGAVLRARHLCDRLAREIHRPLEQLARRLVVAARQAGERVAAATNDEAEWCGVL